MTPWTDEDGELAGREVGWSMVKVQISVVEVDIRTKSQLLPLVLLSILISLFPLYTVHQCHPQTKTSAASHPCSWLSEDTHKPRNKSRYRLHSAFEVTRR